MRVVRPPSRRRTTPVTRSPSRSTSTARASSTGTAPSVNATWRMWASSSVRGTAPPWAGSEPPGQGSSSSWPNPAARRPRLRPRLRTHSPRPSRSSSAIARGVSPSPQGLSRGNTAASARTTSRPARTAQAAAAEPAGPAPTTRTSVEVGEGTALAGTPPVSLVGTAPLQGPAASLRVAGGSGVLLLWPAGAHLLHRRHGLPQLAQPLLGVLADQPDRPGQGLGAGAGDPGVDERVENQPLGLPEPGHDGNGQVGEHFAGVTDGRTPGDRPAVALLRGVVDRHPLLAGLLPEPGDAPGPRGGRIALARLRLGQRADDRDLVAVDDQLDRPGEPAVGQPAGQPSGNLATVDRRRRLSAAAPAAEPAAAAATPSAAELAGERPPAESMCVHDTLPASVLITQLHGKPGRGCQEAAIAALRADTSVTGVEHTKPRQTYAAGRPPTSGRSASSGTPEVSGSPVTTTAPGLVEARAAAASTSRSGPAGPLTATSSGPASSASPTAAAQPAARGARSTSRAREASAASPSSRWRGAPASAP